MVYKNIRVSIQTSIVFLSTIQTYTNQDILGTNQQSLYLSSNKILPIVLQFSQRIGNNFYD